LYPKLSDEQIARLSQVGTRRTVPEGEILFDQGSVTFCVLKAPIPQDWSRLRNFS